RRTAALRALLWQWDDGGSQDRKEEQQELPVAFPLEREPKKETQSPRIEPRNTAQGLRQELLDRGTRPNFRGIVHRGALKQCRPAEHISTVSTYHGYKIQQLRPYRA